MSRWKSPLILVALSAAVWLTVVYTYSRLGHENNIVSETRYATPPHPWAAGRRAQDGRWFTQTTPFRVHAYSAFYDSRWSLLDDGPRLVIVLRTTAEFSHCFAWFIASAISRYQKLQLLVQLGRDAEKRRAIAGVVFSSHDNKPMGILLNATMVGEQANHLVYCRIPKDLIERSIFPVNVSLGVKVENGSIVMTRFRLPVEPVIQVGDILRQKPRKDGLMVCLASAYGHHEPHRLIEWLEVQRILGVERVVVYNRSLADQAGRVFLRYASLGDGFVKIRQTYGRLLNHGGNFPQQVTTSNDCLYRHVGQFRYIAFYDLDELLVPRDANRTLLNTLHTFASGNKTIASFVFQNAYFFTDNELVDWKATSLEPLPTSFYLSVRRRSAPNGPAFVTKVVVDADGCVLMGVHNCLNFTPAFRSEASKPVEQENSILSTKINDVVNVQSNIRPTTNSSSGGGQLTTKIEELLVPPSVALKHHYCKCVLDSWGAGNCTVEKLRAIVDDTLLAHRNVLVARLRAYYDMFNVTAWEKGIEQKRRE